MNIANSNNYGITSTYKDYQNIALYPTETPVTESEEVGVSAEYLLHTAIYDYTTNIELLEMFQPNTITNISNLFNYTNAPNTTGQLTNLGKYIYDATTNTTGPIKKDALCDYLLSGGTNYGSGAISHMLYVADLTMSSNFYASSNGSKGIVIILKSDSKYLIRLKSSGLVYNPDNYDLNTTPIDGSSAFVMGGNITQEEAIEIQNGTFTGAKFIIRDISESNDNKTALLSNICWITLADNVKFYMNGAELSSSVTNIFNTKLGYIDISTQTDPTPAPYILTLKDSTGETTLDNITLEFS